MYNLTDTLKWTRGEYLISNIGLGVPALSVKVTEPAKYTRQASSYAANQSSSAPAALSASGT